MGNSNNVVGGSESFRVGDILKIAVLMHYEDKSVVKCQYAGCDGKTIYNRVWGACAVLHPVGKSWAQLFAGWEKMSSTFLELEKIELNFFQVEKNWAQLFPTCKKMSSTFLKLEKFASTFPQLRKTWSIFGQLERSCTIVDLSQSTRDIMAKGTHHCNTPIIRIYDILSVSGVICNGAMSWYHHNMGSGVLPWIYELSMGSIATKSKTKTHFYRKYA